jgi:hypothetical protein
LNSWWIAFGIILALTVLTRMHKIAEPEHVW